VDWNWFIDLAITEKQTADYTAMARIGVIGPNVLVQRAYRFRWEWPKIKRRIKRMMKIYPEDEFVFEKRTLELMALQDLRDGLDYTNQLRLVEQAVDGDKLARAQAFIARVNEGFVFVAEFPQRFAWAEEHRRFPSTHDDFVDTSSLAMAYYGFGRGLAFILPPLDEPPEQLRLYESLFSIGAL